jgi:FkbM family methyltransferase
MARGVMRLRVAFGSLSFAALAALHLAGVLRLMEVGPARWYRPMLSPRCYRKGAIGSSGSPRSIEGLQSMTTTVTSLSQQLKYLSHEDAFRRNPVAVLARLAWWRGITALGRKPTRVDLPGYNVSIEIPPRWRGIAKLIFAYRELYDRELVWLSKNVRPGSVTVDVGANYGIYSIVAAKAAGASGLVLSFEPAAETFEILEKNIALNHLTNVRLFNCALGDREDDVPLYHHPDASRNSLGAVTGMSGTSETVRMTTLEVVCLKPETTRIDLLKIDVEGAEETTLRGCLPILRLSRPRLIIEINPPRAAAIGLAADGAWRMLLELGYRLHELEANGELREVISLPDRPVNLIAIPR